MQPGVKQRQARLRLRCLVQRRSARIERLVGLLQAARTRPAPQRAEQRGGQQHAERARARTPLAARRGRALPGPPARRGLAAPRLQT